MSQNRAAVHSVKVTEFERRQMFSVQKELDQEYEAMVGLNVKPSKDETRRGAVISSMVAVTELSWPAYRQLPRKAKRAGTEASTL